MSSCEFMKNGSAYINSEIEKAVLDASRTAVISGKWVVDRAVRIPSNFTLILEDCHLRMADVSFENMFVNEHHDTELGRTKEGTDRNINLIGRGEAIIDGGEYNGLSEKNHLKDGMPPIWKNNLLLFTNVDGFKVSDISFRNQRWWALNFIFCSNGYIGNIDFCANDIMVAEDGSIIHGLRRDSYSKVLVKNADGVDLRMGCHDILIENITGFVEDDTVALTALHGRTEKNFYVEGLPTDICNVTVRNVVSASFCSNVRLLNQGDIKLHDIVVDGVCDVAHESEHMDRGIYAVRVGDTRLYGKRHSTKEETYNITVKNVRGGGDSVIALAGEIGNLVLYGIEAFNGAKMLLDKREK